MKSAQSTRSGLIVILLTVMVLASFQPIGSRLIPSERGDEWTNNDTMTSDPCFILTFSPIVFSNGSLWITHPLFQVLPEDGIYPGVIYQINLEIEPSSEFILEYWYGSSGSIGSGGTSSSTDESRFHLQISSPSSSIISKKRRHQRDRRDSPLLDLWSSSTNQTTWICSRNVIGGSNLDNNSAHNQIFNWVLKNNPYTNPTSTLRIFFRLKFRKLLEPETPIYEENLSLKIKSNCHHTVKVKSRESTKLNLRSLWSPTSENMGLNCSVMLHPPLNFGLTLKFTNLSIYGIRGLCRARYISFYRVLDDLSDLGNPLLSKYCGKTEDYSGDEKEISFRPSELLNSPEIELIVSLPGYVKPREDFDLEVKALSPCERVILANLSGSLEYNHQESDSPSLCAITIHVPYGNTIELELRLFPPLITQFKTDQSIPESTEDEESENLSEFQCILNSRGDGNGTTKNAYFVFRVEEFPPFDANGIQPDIHTHIFCVQRHLNHHLVLQRHWKSDENQIKIIFTLNSNFPHFQLLYRAQSIPELRRGCELGWIYVEETGCVKLIEDKLSWTRGEEECQRFQGHLLTIKNDFVQQKIQLIITNSASFRPRQAYWVGANDRESEGNFQWTSGHAFIFTNWFPGWTGSGNNEVLNGQPNDDGLSGQDCVELRQDFISSNHKITGSSRPVVKSSSTIQEIQSSDRSSTTRIFGKRKINGSELFGSSRNKAGFHWNDRNCQSLNYFLCEQSSYQEIEYNCNRTIQLGLEPPQMSMSSTTVITSPGYPSSYPDNTACIITMETGMDGYRIVASFDEFHLEDSPGCKYDTLEIIDGPNDEHEDDLVRTGTRICGDWNRRLKLLNFKSNSSSVTFKFESDFSHHFPGFKAKVWMEKVIPKLSFDEEVAEECHGQKMEGFGSYCYLVVSHPVLNWDSAQQFCSSIKASLVSILSLDEWRFLTRLLVSSPDYHKKSMYWLGGTIDHTNQLVWKDHMPFNFSAFHPSDLQSIAEWKCLSLYWHDGGTGTFAWKLSNCNQHFGYICKKQTKVESMDNLGLNKTVAGIGGKLSSMNFPNNYLNNMNYVIRIHSPSSTQIVIQFSHLDIEYQDDCVYDYLEVHDLRTQNSSRVCGTITGKELRRFDYVSSGNGLELIFHSDDSDVYSGFELMWRAVDVSECLSGKTILLGNSGNGAGFLLPQSTIHSPNFPNFNLPSMNCIYIIVAPAGQRIWFQFDIFEIGIESNDGTEEQDEDIENSLRDATSRQIVDCDNRDHVIVDLASATGSINEHWNEAKKSRHSLILCGNLTSQPHRTSFVSYGDRMTIQLMSNDGLSGRGFFGRFKSLPSFVHENLAVQTEPNSSFFLTSINYPLQPPSSVNLTLSLTSPPNFIIRTRIRGIDLPNCHLTSSAFLVIYDPYVGSNGTSWTICHPDSFPYGEETDISNEVSNTIAPIWKSTPAEFQNVHNSFLRRRSAPFQSVIPVMFNSTFNRLEIIQVYRNEGIRRKWVAEVATSLDENFRSKVLSTGDRLLILNACKPNPCLNGGRCVTDGEKHICRCSLPFTGPFCGLSVCDLNPCMFGDCIIEEKGFKCNCHIGFQGDRCDRRSKPCTRDGKEDKCSGHGECIEVNENSYRCHCYAYWEGPACESRMQNIPFRPLSERMFREPFWLGIITVTVVLSVIGLVWCLKRHFPDKLEKFLNDDSDRNRRISWVSARSPSSFRLGGGGCSYHGIREIIPGTSQQATSPQTAKTFLGRFGIRKPSLLSLSSATSVSAAATSPHSYENRTFSLDDLLRPSRSSMMRTPSPHRRRNFSIHSRRDPMEKQQILQQLVSSGASVSLDGTDSKPPTPKPTIAEIIQMSEKRLRLASLGSSSSGTNQNEPTQSTSTFLEHKAPIETETSFIGQLCGTLMPASVTAASKAEKRVTFARLLEKLTAHELSSSSSCSDLSCAEDSNRTILNVNPKPPKKERRGRLRRSKAYNSRSRNSETDQDGFDISSSDTTPDPVYPPRFPSRICVSPTGLSVSASNSPSLKSGKSLTKMASADSLLALFRRFSGSSSAPPSPQYSENEDSSAGATPLSTPSSPRNSALSLNIRPPAFLITTPEITVDSSTSPGHDGFGGGGPGSWRAQAQNLNVISLEVPMRDHCLSPIHEVPTPLPTPSHSPAHTPLLHRPKSGTESSPHLHGLPLIKLQASSEAEEEDEVHRSPKKSLGSMKRSKPTGVPSISISVDEELTIVPDFTQADDLSDEPTTKNGMPGGVPDVLIHVSTADAQQRPANRFSFDEVDLAHIDGRTSPGRNKTRPPPLVFANEMMNDVKSPKNDGGPDSGRPIIATIPELHIEHATPLGTPDLSQRQDDISYSGGRGGSVPPPDITAFPVIVSPRPWEVSLLPPIILINQATEVESDIDFTLTTKLVRRPILSFLNPFVASTDRVPSESNLSTSGYSSMASPCPSRCPSVSPLCPDSDDYHHGGSRRSSLVTPGSSRKSSLTLLLPRRSSLNAASPLISTFTGLGLADLDLSERTEIEPELDMNPEIVSQENNEIQEIVDGGILNLLNVPRKNLPKSLSLDMNPPTAPPEKKVARSEPVTGRGKLRKCDSLDSKLNQIPLEFKIPSLLTLLKEREAKMCRLPIHSRNDSMSDLSVRGNLTGGFNSPITDSDGHYDYFSSDVQMARNRNVNTEISDAKKFENTSHLSPLHHQTYRRGRRKPRRRRDVRKAPILYPIPTFPEKIGIERNESRLFPLPSGHPMIRRTSPKRRGGKIHTNYDLNSSSSDSLESHRSREIKPSSPSGSSSKMASSSLHFVSTPEVSHLESSDKASEKTETSLPEPDDHIPINLSGENAAVTLTSQTMRTPSKSRLKAISLQIRFLRRLEKSLVKKRETLNVMCGSSEPLSKKVIDCDVNKDSEASSDWSRSCSTCSNSTSICNSSCSSSSSTSSGEEDDIPIDKN